MTLLHLYLRHAARPGRALSVDGLVEEGYSRPYAQVLLHRLRKEGAAEAISPGRVQLVEPGSQPLAMSRNDEPWKRTLETRFKTKATGMSVLPHRYPGPRPQEFMVPPNQLRRASTFLRTRYPGLRVVEGRFALGEDTVCLYGGRVRGKKASREEALVHLYRHAPREEFALALQAVLMQDPELDWRWFQRQPEWLELAGIFKAVNDRLTVPVFPRFRDAQLPDLTYAQLDTVTQAFAARSEQ